MSSQKTTLVFVHGYSVSEWETYGELPLRLKAEAASRDVALDIEEIFLGKYISLNDEVQLKDIARAFEKALYDKLGDKISNGDRFCCITHSTGGPVVREWFDGIYADQDVVCPMSHLIMLAPANFGSALAQLGKGRLSRLKTWFQGVEPGQQVLNWLELGSENAWQLNMQRIANAQRYAVNDKIFPFVLSGQSIDRKFYDHLNAYTGELGSDGVIRLAAANLNSRYALLEQDKDVLEIKQYKEHTDTPFKIVGGKSHGGADMGIMASVEKELDDTKSKETIDSIFRCLEVQEQAKYVALAAAFDLENIKTQEDEKVERQDKLFKKDRYFIHDRFFQIIFKVVDDQGNPVNDYDLLLTGEGHDPNALPAGFYKDRQQNRISPNVITYYLNYDIMAGCEAVVDEKKNMVLREAQPGISELGIILTARPDKGMVQYASCSIKAGSDLMKKAVKPNSTTMIEIVLKRKVDKRVFELLPLTGNQMPKGKF